jgi:hypothetical protein
MGFYWNPIDERWSPIDHERKLSRSDRNRIERRSDLIEGLLAEIKMGRDGIIQLYTGLLVRTLAASDEILMRKYGEQIAVLVKPEGQSARGSQ